MSVQPIPSTTFLLPWTTAKNLTVVVKDL